MEQVGYDPAAEAIRLAMEDQEMAELLEAGESRNVRIAWENYVRCFFLMALLFFIGFLAWQPSRLRFSMLMSLANPSRGESLAWRPEETPAPPPAEIKRQSPPPEWRLGPAYSSLWNTQRAPSKNVSPGVGRVATDHWPRVSGNPWYWQDDVTPGRRRAVDPSIQPPQKPASSHRVGNILAWPERHLTPGAASGSPDEQPASVESLPSLTSRSAVQPSSSPITIPALSGSLPPVPEALSGPTGGLEPLVLPSLGTLDRGQAETAGAVSATSMQPPAPPTTAIIPAPPPPEQQIDWKNREITGPIPGAYLTIYPKLKFIGLCVPGQGYVRKYNQVGVPGDLTNPKMSAQDGRTPYGKYYIADRHRDADGPRLFLSWPSPEDAHRIGLDPGRTAQVLNAWRRQELPPQDTRAGGGVGLNGLRNWVEVTEGGFALEEPHMEEIFTALPDKAWVFVQP